MGENKAVKKRFSAILILMFVSCLLFAAEIRVAFPAAHIGNVILPVDSEIGQLAEEDSHEAVAVLAAALREEYSFEWTETHIHESVRASLVKLFGSWFSENLPASAILFSVPHENPDGTVGVNVRIGESCVSFILEGNQIISMRLF